MIAAIIPFKNATRAKSRLASLLQGPERAGLVHAMLGDVLDALAGARHIDQTFIVAENDEVAEAAAAQGATVIREIANRGYNAAVATAVNSLTEDGEASVVVVPCDIPMVTAAELDALARPAAGKLVRAAPARDGVGTNGLFLSPAKVMESRFGPDSARRHRREALAAGVAYEELRRPGLGFDIDVPSDLADFCALSPPTRTSAFLRGLSFPERLSTSSGRSAVDEMAMARHAARIPE